MMALPCKKKRMLSLTDNIPHNVRQSKAGVDLRCKHTGKANWLVSFTIFFIEKVAKISLGKTT